MSAVIKANQSMDILFVGEIPTIGNSIIGCVKCKDTNTPRIYFRITGGLYRLSLTSNTSITANTAMCKATSTNIEFSDTFLDSDVPVGEWVPQNAVTLDTFNVAVASITVIKSQKTGGK